MLPINRKGPAAMWCCIGQAVIFRFGTNLLEDRLLPLFISAIRRNGSSKQAQRPNCGIRLLNLWQNVSYGIRRLEVDTGLKMDLLLSIEPDSIKKLPTPVGAGS